jgi:hypothetical protein
LRKAFYLNDMRYWYGTTLPCSPLLLCGGQNDPTVFYSVNTGTMAAFWHALPTVLTLNIDPSTAPSGPFAAIEAGFQVSEAQELAYLQTAAGGALTLAEAEQDLIEGYHVAVDPFCALAARSFFAPFVE